MTGKSRSVPRRDFMGPRNYALFALRLLFIRFPLRRHARITKKKALIVIGMIWAWAGTLALPWVLFFDLAYADEGQPSVVFCVESWPGESYRNAYFILVNLVLFYLLPLGIIVVCHVFIWLKVWRRQLPGDSAVSRVELLRQRVQVRVTKMLILVVVLFTISWLPLYSIVFRLKFGATVIEGSVEDTVSSLALPIAQWLGASNSCVNPVIYAFFNAKFRRALVALFRGLD